MELRHGRTPTQQRARDRVERVLGAAAHVFADKGYARATTNTIAEQAGVVVPSVYQYFANKDALLAELWDRHVGEMMDMLEAMIAAYPDAPIDVTARMYVEAILAAHARTPQLLAVLYAESPRLAGVRNLRAEATALLVPYLQRHAASIRTADLTCVAFVLAAAVEGVAKQAVVPPAPPSEVLVEELTTLVTAYLGVV
ncbi:MAG: TetR/AcrR family transcriptional regulator [Myxococcota bacterium]